MSKKPKKLLKLDLGAGQNCRDGFLGVDLYNGCAVRCDLFKFPWPWKDQTVEEVHCSHFFEHVPGELRFRFMDELYRIMVPDGKATFITPYWSSSRSVQDPTHQWPPVTEASYLYFNKGWREQNKLDHYPVKCDFDFSYGFMPDPETVTRNGEAQQHWMRHYVNAINDLQVTLTRRP